MSDDLSIEVFSPSDIDEQLEPLARLLNACVGAGANIGFIEPFALGDSRAFWAKQVCPALAAGTRFLLVAKISGQIAGAVQLDFDLPGNQAHRAEVSKLIVHPDHRRCGVARALMAALETGARQLGRKLITLDTASEGAESLYRALGFETAGVIPAFARAPEEDRLEATTYMYKFL